MGTQGRSPGTVLGSGNVHERNRRLRDTYVELESLAKQADKEADRATATRLRERMRDIANRFVSSNSDLVAPVARKFRTADSRSHWGDYDAAGMLGLWEAFQKWDPDKATFGTFSRQYIEGRVRREVSTIEHAGLSYHDFTERDKIRKVQASLHCDTGIEPDHREVADAASELLGRNVTVDQVERVSRGRPASLDRKVSGDDGGASLGELIADEIEDVTSFDDVDIAAVQHVLAEMDPLTVYVVVRHLGLDGSDGQSFSDIAATCGIGRELLRRRFNDAVKTTPDPAETRELEHSLM